MATGEFTFLARVASEEYLSESCIFGLTRKPWNRQQRLLASMALTMLAKAPPDRTLGAHFTWTCAAGMQGVLWTRGFRVDPIIQRLQWLR